MESGRQVNILLLGESGAGKSTFINSFANFMKYKTLEEALGQSVSCPIPVDFTLINDDYSAHRVWAGKDPNEHHEEGRSTTQDPKEYAFLVRDGVLLRIIDSPGVGDSRGVAQDVDNVRRTMEFVAGYGHINAVVFLLKTNVSVLNEYFKFCVTYLLTRLEPAVLTNVVYVFTHSRSTCYRPGDTLAVLRRVLEEHRHFRIPCCKDNMFCVDHEAFRYLMAHNQGVRFLGEEVAQFGESWRMSYASCMRLLDYVIGAGGDGGLEPYRIHIAVDREEILKTARTKITFLTDLLLVLIDNDRIASNLQKSGTKRGELVHLKRVKGGQAVVSKNPKNLETVEITDVKVQLYIKKCHEPCDCPMPNEHTDLAKCSVFSRAKNTCIACNCKLESHSKIIYERKIRVQQLPSQNTYMAEIEELLPCLATYTSFLRCRTKTKGDIFKDHGMKCVAKDKHKSGTFKELKAIYDSWLVKISEASAEDVHARWEALKKLEFTGQAIAEVFGSGAPPNVEDLLKKTIKKMNEVALAVYSDCKERKDQQSLYQNCATNLLVAFQTFYDVFMKQFQSIMRSQQAALNKATATNYDENISKMEDVINSLKDIQETLEETDTKACGSNNQASTSSENRGKNYGGHVDSSTPSIGLECMASSALAITQEFVSTKQASTQDVSTKQFSSATAKELHNDFEDLEVQNEPKKKSADAIKSYKEGNDEHEFTIEGYRKIYQEYINKYGPIRSSDELFTPPKVGESDTRFDSAGAASKRVSGGSRYFHKTISQGGGQDRSTETLPQNTKKSLGGSKYPDTKENPSQESHSTVSQDIQKSARSREYSSDRSASIQISKVVPSEEKKRSYGEHGYISNVDSIKQCDNKSVKITILQERGRGKSRSKPQINDDSWPGMKTTNIKDDDKPTWIS